MIIFIAFVLPEALAFNKGIDRFGELEKIGIIRDLGL